MDNVEEVRSKARIEDVISSYVQLKNAGRNLKGLCPFHHEKSPSFMVNPELSIYKCFGCGKGGDVFNFVEEIEGVDFKEALKILAERVGVKLKIEKDGAVDYREELYETNGLAMEYFNYLLTSHKVGDRAKKYLLDRGVNEKLMSTYKIGYAMNSWDGLKTFLVGKKKKNLKTLIQSGLVIESSKGGYDRFRNRVMFPFFDERGKVVGFSGRILPGEQKGKENEAKYVNSPESPVYHKSRILYGLFQAKKEIREKNRVVLVEGQMDAVSSFGAGVGETVAVGGTSLTKEQLELIARYTKNVVLALDADFAGGSATIRSIELCESLGMNVKIVQIKGGKDPDEIARQNPTKWRKMVEKAVEVYDFVIDLSILKNDIASATGKKAVTEEVVPFLAKITNQVVLSHYIKKLSEKLRVSEESVILEIKKVSRQEVLGVKKETIKKDVVSREERLKIEIMARLLLKKGLVKKISAQKRELLDQKFLNGVLRWSEEEIALSELIKGLDEDQARLWQEASCLEVDEDRAERDFIEAVTELVELLVKLRLSEKRMDLIKAEEEGDDEKVSGLMREYAYLLKQIRE